jgi:predicted negative regulator of RcsB-dependent stress response
VPIQRLARLHLALGEQDEALALLLRADAEKIVGLEQVKGDPAFEPLKDDPRFVALLERIGPPD